MLASGLQVLMLRHQDITMGSAKFICVFIGTKLIKKAEIEENSKTTFYTLNRNLFGNI